MTTSAPKPGWMRSVEALHFAVTNYLPRRAATRWMGWFSQLEHPLVRDVSIGLFRRFADLRLDEAASAEFRSLHDCFTRALKPGARPFDADPAVVASPCDGIVGGCGALDGRELLQAKSRTYALEELLLDAALAQRLRGGRYVTLRLSASMYHRFHAPHDCEVRHVTYVAGDTWNTHPFTLERVDKLYCKNERAILRAQLTTIGAPIVLVPVAAILVASIRLHFLDVLLHLDHPGPNELPCRAPLRKGEEMGFFQHGSTMLVLAPEGFELCEHVRAGALLQAGQALLRAAAP